MPTLIDSLVVSLTLDASSFTQEQKRAIEALRKLERQASRSASTARKSLGAWAVSFFRMIESPAVHLRRQFEALATHARIPQRALRDISDTAKQTGEEVEHSAGRGASALMAFGVAGVAAFAAYEALSKTIGAVNRMSGGVFSTGLGAYLGGMGIQQFSAVAKALNTLGNVPEEQTESFMTNLGQMRSRYTRNPEALASMQSAFAQAGISGQALWAPYGPHYQIDLLMDIHRQLAEMSPDARQRAISNLADIIPGSILNALAQPTLPAEFQKQLQNAPTEEQQKKVTDLIQAENELSQHVSSLERTILIYLVPPLAALAKWLDASLSSGQMVAASGLPSDWAMLASSGINPATGQSGMMGWVKEHMPASVYNWLSGFPALAPKNSSNGGLNTPGSAGGSSIVKGSVFGWSSDSYNEIQANGQPVSAGPGIALPNRSTLGQWFNVTAPNGQTYKLRQTDVGPAAWTGRGVDINATAAALMGYNKGNFPTDSNFTVTPTTGGTNQADAVVASMMPSVGHRFVRACAELVNKALRAAGLPTSGSNQAVSFTQYGQYVSASRVQRGDIFYSGPSGGGDTGHVGIALGPIVDGKVQVVSSHLQGAADNPAGVEWRDAANLLFRHPNYRAIQAANAASTTNNSGGNTTLNGDIHVHVPTGTEDSIGQQIYDQLHQTNRAATANNGLQ